jgi:chromosome segregation ATPase
VTNECAELPAPARAKHSPLSTGGAAVPSLTDGGPLFETELVDRKQELARVDDLLAERRRQLADANRQLLQIAKSRPITPSFTPTPSNFPNLAPLTPGGISQDTCSRSEIQFLERQVQQQEDEINALKKDHASKISVQNSRFEAEKQKSSAILKAKEEIIRSKTAEIELLHQSEIKLRQYDLLVKEYNDIKQKNQGLNADLKQMKEKYQVEIDSSGKRIAQLELLVQQIPTLKQILEENDLLWERLGRKLTQSALRPRQKGESPVLSDRMQFVEEIIAKNQALVDRVNELETLSEKHQSQMADTEREKAEIEQNYQLLHHKAVKIKKAWRSVTKRFNQAEQEIQRLSELVESQSATINRVTELETELSESQRVRDEFEAQLSTLRQSTEKIESQRKEIEEQLSAQTTKLAELNSRFSTISRELEDERQAKAFLEKDQRAEITRLEAELSESQRVRDEFETQLSTLRQSTEEIESQRKEIEEQLSAQTTKFAEFDSQFSTISRELEDERQAKAFLEKDQRAEITRLETELS